MSVVCTHYIKQDAHGIEYCVCDNMAETSILAYIYAVQGNVWLVCLMSGN